MSVNDFFDYVFDNNVLPELLSRIIFLLFYFNFISEFIPDYLNKNNMKQLFYTVA